MKRFFTLALCASLASTTSFGGYFAKNNDISVQINQYNLHDDSLPKHLCVGNITKNNLIGLELKVFNEADHEVVIHPNNIAIPTLSLKDVDAVFGWSPEKAGMQGVLQIIGWLAPGIFALIPICNPDFWRQHGFWKGFGTLLTCGLAGAGTSMAVTTPTLFSESGKDFLEDFSEAIENIGACKSELQNGKIDQHTAQANILQNYKNIFEKYKDHSANHATVFRIAGVAGLASRVGVLYAMMRHFDSKDMEIVKDQYLYEPITLAPGEMTTKLVYVNHDYFRKLQISNQSFNITCTTPENKIAAKFEIPAGHI